MPEADSHTLSVDRACHHCGYNLRGLIRDGNCPECGRPIADSLRGDFLEHADPEWLDKLRFGCTLKFWNIVLAGLAGAFASGFVRLGLPGIVVSGIAFIGSALGVWASFAITTQEPRISLQEDPITWRKLIRICVVASFLGSLLPQSGTSTPLAIVVTLLGTALGIAGVVSFFGELVYLRRFALRVPDPLLAKSTKTVQWGGAIMIALGIVTATLVAIFAGGSGGAQIVITGPNVGGAAGVMILAYVCVFAIAGLVLGIWYLTLLGRYRRAFEKAALTARSAAA